MSLTPCQKRLCIRVTQTSTLADRLLFNLDGLKRAKNLGVTFSIGHCVVPT